MTELDKTEVTCDWHCEELLIIGKVLLMVYTIMGGLAGVLVTCDIDNRASARVIERNGGIFRDASPATDNDKETARYWIDLRRRKPAEDGRTA